MPMSVEHPHLRRLRRVRDAAAGRRPGRRAGRRLARRSSSSPACAPARSSARDRACRSARRSRPATAPRIAQGERAAVRPRPARVRDRRPRRPRAARARRRAARRAACPRTPPVGLTGLEREFDARLAGTPGGDAATPGRACSPASRRGAGRSVRTTIDPDVQRAAVEALAGRYGGIAVVRPRTGEVLALAGDRVLGAAAARLDVQDRHARRRRSRRARSKRNESVPGPDAATLEGVELQNANGESCGGSLRDSFAHSCNSVFAPLGAKLGAREARRDRRALRLQRGPAAGGRGALDDPGRGRDRRRPRRRLDRDRPGQGADHAAADGADRRDDRRGRPALACRRCSAASGPSRRRSTRPGVARTIGRATCARS